MPCKWGKQTEQLRNSSAWLCMYPIPLSMVAEVGFADPYQKMRINECLCTKEICRCYEQDPKYKDSPVKKKKTVLGITGDGILTRSNDETNELSRPIK